MATTTYRKSKAPVRKRAAAVRKATLKVNGESARAIRSGHPWVFRHAILNPAFTCADGEIIDVTDPENNFLARGFFESEGTVAVRIFTRDEKEAIDEAFFRRACERAIELRRTFLEPDLDVYRLVHQESDGLPGVTITRFGNWLQAILYSPAAAGFVDRMYPALLELTGAKGIYEQIRFKSVQKEDSSRRGSKLVAGEEAPLEVPIREDGLSFLIDITAPSSVGFFPDYRLGRRRIRQLSGERRVLNLFSHTGAFCVHALAGGATRVVNADISQKAHSRTRQNVELNGFSPDRIACYGDDVFRIVSMLQRKKEQFDLVVIDPPTFSTDKNRTWSGPRDIMELLHETSKICAPGALLLVTSNTVKLPMEVFEKQVASGLAARRPLILERPGLPVDYPEIPSFSESGYLKSLLVRID